MIQYKHSMSFDNPYFFRLRITKLFLIYIYILLIYLFSMCPANFSYFNQSCFFVVNPPSPAAWSGNEGPGKAADDYCISHHSALSASLHSFDEQWFLYHLYQSKIGYFYGQWVVLGSYKTNYTDNSLRSYHWYDGSPLDFIPEIALWKFTVLDNNEYLSPHITMVIE